MSHSSSTNALPPARILGIETSCDETADSIVEIGRVILASLVASQADLHARYGGVFPEVASRQHILTIYPIVEQALRQAHLTLKDVDAVAVTRGPGLAGSLVVGLNLAKGGGAQHDGSLRKTGGQVRQPIREGLFAVQIYQDAV